MKDWFRRCVDMKADLLTHKRLRLPDSEGDPVAAGANGDLS